MTVQLLGVRGSTPAPGRQFVDVGGHTSCVAVHPATEDDPWLVLDGGTGFRNLAGLLGDTPLHAQIILTHLHWDHVQGLPFLRQSDRDDAQITLWIPSGDGDGDEDALERLAGGFSPPHFPIRPDQLRGHWSFRALDPGDRAIGSRTVSAAEVEHKGGRTMGLRVEDGGRSFAYIPDHAVSTAPVEQLLHADRLAADVDVLFHGAPYLAAEEDTATHFGHSTVRDAVDVAVRNDVGRLVLAHHAPNRSDDQFEQVLTEAQDHVRSLGSDLHVEIGRELAVHTI